LFIKLFFVEAYGIPSGSMENTLMTGDYLIVNKIPFGLYSPRTFPLTSWSVPFIKLLPGYRSPDRGEIVIFEMPQRVAGSDDEVRQCFVKRLTGLPGDTVEIAGKRLLVNGVVQEKPVHAQFDSYMLRKSEVEPDIFPKGMPFNKDWWGPVVVPYKGQEIELNAHSLDQWRQFIEREGHSVKFSVDGRIEIDEQPADIYKVERNYYFFLGDNRDNSIDSRYWGYVPERNLIGTPILIYWSWDSSIPWTSPIRLLSSIRWDRFFSTAQ
jgi:signal peptidase I